MNSSTHAESARWITCTFDQRAGGGLVGILLKGGPPGLEVPIVGVARDQIRDRAVSTRRSTVPKGRAEPRPPTARTPRVEIPADRQMDASIRCVSAGGSPRDLITSRGSVPPFTVQSSSEYESSLRRSGAGSERE